MAQGILPRTEGHPIRVVIANLPSLLGKLIGEAVTKQPDMVLKFVVENPLETLAAVNEGVDVVVLGADETYPPPGVVSHLLTQFPHVRVLTVVTNGDDVGVYWMGARFQAETVTSKQTLIQLLREAYNEDEMNFE